MAELFNRVVQLWFLVFAPRIPAPEPTSAGTGADVLVGLLLLLGPIAIAGWLVRRYETREAKGALAMWVLAAMALLFEARWTQTAGKPVLRGYYLAAPFVWAALGLTLATLAAQYLSVSFKNKRMGAFLVTIAIGIFIFRDATDYIANEKSQWRVVLKNSPAHELALLAVVDELRNAPEGAEDLERCIQVEPTSCVCRTVRAERWLASNNDLPQPASVSRAVTDLEEGVCGPGHKLLVRATGARAVAYALRGRVEEAESAANSQLGDHPNDAKLLYALALVRNAQQLPDEALALVKRAVDAGAGRGAEILLAQQLIQMNDLPAARTYLKDYLTRHHDDVDALYNHALVADKQGDYNAAREGYLATIKAGPRTESGKHSRLNLVYLTQRFNVRSEAQFHARKFVEAWPDDPRGEALMLLVGKQ